MTTLINGTTETISKSLINIPRKHEIKEQQETTYWALHTYFGKY